MSEMRMICGICIAAAALSPEVSVAVGAAAETAITRGALCLTFDDRNFDAWERSIPLFAKFGAHATFFVCGPIDARAESLLGFQKLLLAGSDVFYGQFLSKSVDDGKTWSEPVEIAGIDPFDDCDFCREIVDFDKMS